MNTQLFFQKSHIVAIVGLLLSIPALIMVSFGLLWSAFGIHGPVEALDQLMNRFGSLRLLIHPAIVLGGTFVALALNVAPVLRLRFQVEERSFIATVVTKDRERNIAVVLLAMFLLAAILSYAFTENFRIVPR